MLRGHSTFIGILIWFIYALMSLVHSNNSVWSALNATTNSSANFIENSHWSWVLIVSISSNLNISVASWYTFDIITTNSSHWACQTQGMLNLLLFVCTYFCWCYNHPSVSPSVDITTCHICKFHKCTFVNCIFGCFNSFSWASLPSGCRSCSEPINTFSLNFHCRTSHVTNSKRKLVCEWWSYTFFSNNTNNNKKQQNKQQYEYFIESLQLPYSQILFQALQTTNLSR